MQEFLITVNLSQGQQLKFKVHYFKIEEGRCRFIDRLTNLPKDFPHEICYIEGVKT